jgi:hypothetical protein
LSPQEEEAEEEVLECRRHATRQGEELLQVH